MLVLQRKKNESIIIGDIITVSVIEIRGDKVRLGIDAPQNVSVHREEVWLAIVREQHADEPAEDPVSTLDPKLLNAFSRLDGIMKRRGQPIA